MEIKKAIIPIAGLGTRFLPLSKALPKEFFPLVDKPIIQYIIDEAKKSGITEIVFVLSPRQKTILNYFKKDSELEKILIKRKKENILRDLKDLANSFGDDIIDSDIPALLQLAEIFKTCNAPVLGLKVVPRERVPAYGMITAEKIASRLYKIKKITEKPDLSQVTSNLVVIGKHILTPEVFEYLNKAKPSKKGEIILAEVFDKMLSDGKTIYGYELKGEWLECGDKLKWLKSFLYFSIKDARFGSELKQYIKTIK